MAHRLSSRRTARTRDQGERRRQLVAAAERAVLKHGSGGMRLRDVADEAGLTSGAVLYYYEELDDLLLETINRAIERFGRLREEAVDRIDDPRAKLIACLRGGLPSGPDDALVRLLYEFEGAALRNRAYGALNSACRGRHRHHSPRPRMMPDRAARL